MKFNFIIILLGLMIFLAGCTTNTEPLLPINDAPEPEILEEPIIEGFTLEEITSHDNEDDCWFAINGKVYDVTSIENHPGGIAIYEGCGMDATKLFETRPMGSGTPHSQGARNGLDNYYIGELID